MAVHVRVRLSIAAATSRWWRSAVAFIGRVRAAWWRWVIVHRRGARTWWRTGVWVATTAVVVVAWWWSATAVIVTAWAVATWGSAAVIVIIWRWSVTATRTWRAGAVAWLTRAWNLGLRLLDVSDLFVRGRALESHIRDAADCLILELAAIELLDSLSKIIGSLILDKSRGLVSDEYRLAEYDIPLGISACVTVATDLGVDDVKAWLAGKILQILWQTSESGSS